MNYSSNKLILSAVIVAGFAISGFAFYNSTASVATSKPVVIPDSAVTADGLFNACNQWVKVSSGVTRTTYLKASTCVILLTLPQFKVGHNVIQCEPNDKGVAAYGVLYRNGDTTTSAYECTYTLPVALAE